ncbi:MAG: sugar-binding protein [Bacillota bacterium]
MRVNALKRWSILLTAGLMLFNFSQGCIFRRKTPPTGIQESTVSIVKTDSVLTALTYADILGMVTEAVDLAGGLESVVKNGDTVVIKPNLVLNHDYTSPGWTGDPLLPEANGVTTDWRVVKAVVELVRNINPDGMIYIMEGSAEKNTLEVMNSLKYTAAYIPGVDAFFAIEENSALPDGMVQQSRTNSKSLLPSERYPIYYNKIYKQASVVISIPTLKNHWNAAVTGAIKNVGIGATPANEYTDRQAMTDHNTDDIHCWIHDYYLYRPVNFVVMDGLQGIQNGPTPCYEMTGHTELFQDQMDMRLIIAGKDAVAVDTVEALTIGWDPEFVNYLQYLNSDGVGIANPARINVVGKKVDEVRKYFDGAIPPAGGAKITDKTAPTLELLDMSLDDDSISANLSVAPETVRLEAYIDGQLKYTVVQSGFNNISLDISELGPEDYQLEICAYDRFLNRSSITVAFDKAYGNYLAPKAATAPTIDGSGTDSCWQKAPWRKIDTPWIFDTVTAPDGADDFSGRYKMVWTSDKLYYLVEITDDALRDDHPNPLVNYPDDDCLELFIDEDRSGGNHALNHTAFAYHISTQKFGQEHYVVDLSDNLYYVPIDFSSHAKVRMTQNGDVYTWEVELTIYNETYNDDPGAVNTPETLIAGSVMGYAIAYCDNDTGTRDHFIGSIVIEGPDQNVAWQDAGIFGLLKLVE